MTVKSMDVIFVKSSVFCYWIRIRVHAESAAQIVTRSQKFRSCTKRLNVNKLGALLFTCNTEFLVLRISDCISVIHWFSFNKPQVTCIGVLL